VAQAASISRRLAIARAGRAAILALVVGLGSGGAGLVVAVSSASAHREDSLEPSVRSATEPRPRDFTAKRLDLDGDPLPDGAVARLGTTRFNHGSAIRSVAFTPDGKTLLSLGNDLILRRWDSRTGREHDAPGGLDIRACSYTLSPDGKCLTTFDGEFVRRSDFATGVELSRWVAPSRNASYDLRSMVVSPDGATVAAPSLSAKSVSTLWNLAKTGDGRRLEADEPRISCVAFSPGGDLIATVGPAVFNRGVALKDGRGVPIVKQHEGGSVRIWNVREGTEWQHYLVDGGQPTCVSFSPDGKTLAVGFSDSTLRIYDPAVRKELSCLDTQGQIQISLAFSPDGRTLASGSKSASNTGFDLVPVHLWDVTTFKEMRQILAHEQHVSSLAFAPDGKTLASAGADATVRLWEVATGRRINPSHANRSHISCVLASPIDRGLITAGHDGTIRRWDAGTGRERNGLGTLPLGVENMAISPDGRLFLVVGTDGVVQLRDVISGNELRRLVDRSPSGCLAGLAFSVNGKTACAARRIWDVDSGRELATLRDSQGRDFQPWATHSVAFTPDGKDVIATDQHRVSVFDAATGREVRRVAEKELFNAIALSPDGRFLALLLGRGHVIRLLHLGSGRQVAKPLALGDTGWALAFSRDGRLLAAGSGDLGWNADGSIRVWELASGREICRFQGHRAEVTSIAFLPDSRRIASAGADAIAMVWDIARIEREAESTLGHDDIELFWADLAGDHAAKANRAILALVTAPDRVVPFLAGRLKPIRLDDPAKDTSLGPIASGETLRRLRAISVLEKIGTPDARRILEQLASGLEGARETRDAKAALRQLQRR
jgi:WD40 repeat protein